MCSGKPLRTFEVKPDRMEKAMTSIAAAQRILSEDEATEVIFELGYGDGVSWPEGRMRLELSDLQLVALAAGLAAVAGNGAKVQGS